MLNKISFTHGYRIVGKHIKNTYFFVTLNDHHCMNLKFEEVIGNKK